MTFRANAQQPKLFVGMILILIFAEALALYGLIGELRVSSILQSWLCALVHCCQPLVCLQLELFWLPRLASQLSRCSELKIQAEVS